MKRFKFRLYTFALVTMAAFLSGCSEAEQLTEEMPVPGIQEAAASDLTKMESVALAVQQKGTYKISKSEALESLERYAKSISGNEEAAVQVKSAVLKKSPETGKELYYEVVFEGEKGTGFSILSADERAEELLCYSEVGAIADTSFNESLKFCLELLDRYVEEQTRTELDIEALASSAQEKISSMNQPADQPVTKAIPPFDPNTWTYAGRRSELLYYNLRSEPVPEGWHQYHPFNDSLPNIYGTNQIAPCGDAMIAVAQIMAYHEKPYSNYITASDWASIKANPSASVKLKMLMRDLYYDMIAGWGPAYNSYIVYSNPTKVRAFLNNNGYTVGPNSPYSTNIFPNVWNALAYGPTIICGYRTSLIPVFWVVDGAIDSKYEHYDLYTYYFNGKMYEYRDIIYRDTPQFLNFNWGEGEIDDEIIDIWLANGIFQPHSSLPNYPPITLLSSIQ